MKADTSSSNARHHQASARIGPAPSRAGPYAVLAVLAAIVLLCAFYSVVMQAVSKSHHARQEARLAEERQVLCSAFSTAASRDLCLVTIAARTAAAAQRIVAASYAPAAWKARRPELSAGLY